MQTAKTNEILQRLETDGVVVLPELVPETQLRNMQRAFDTRLQRLRWNDFEGYEKTERFRHMVQDVLTLEQGFVDAVLHPLVKEVLLAYLGPPYELVEAKGWRSIPTMRMFHGWHGDSWYDQNQVKEIPREVKLGMYLTDVETGAFRYVKGSHQKHHPRGWRAHEVDAMKDNIAVFTGKAGTAFLFDTTGIHGQSCPILAPRHAIFYNYHDPSLPLQTEDIEYYRYHPLALNAAFLGGLDDEDRRILGFGNKTNYIPRFERKPQHMGFQSMHRQVFDIKLAAEEFQSRVTAKVGKILGK